ncbi:MAG: MAPEG family protein [Pseudomonadota bacterium]|nr:MAPEG family protein [Pseudomonadota bacterium]
MTTNSELRKEQQKINIAIAVSFFFCLVVVAGAIFLIPGVFLLPIEFGERIAFALQANIFVLVWVVIAVGMVSHGRRHSAADICGSAYAAPSPSIAVRVAFLQNTLEQSVIAAGAYLALATLLSGPALAFIPASVLLFAIGRVTFYLGYPKGAGARAFGIATTMLPTLAGYIWAIFLIAK